ncbi:MAG: guanine nucleotide exchange protein for ADP-robosylation factor [Caeruleum heppii]|nr:MAG: guanine nucleotide exchange protein for ADP-robosylation factor [Caeruleum heppii]
MDDHVASERDSSTKSHGRQPSQHTDSNTESQPPLKHDKEQFEPSNERQEIRLPASPEIEPLSHRGHTERAPELHHNRDEGDDGVIVGRPEHRNTSSPITPSISLEPSTERDLPTLPSDEPSQLPSAVDRDLSPNPNESEPVPQLSPRESSHRLPIASTQVPSNSSGTDGARSDSPATANEAPRGPTLSSVIFVVSALESIGASKEARKGKQLGDAVQKALSSIKESDPQLPDPEIIFEPLQLATVANSIPLATTALDCIGKLISYSYFSSTWPSPRPPQPGDTPPPPPLIERAIDTIIDCFQGEATPVETQLQIVKSLLAAVLNDKIIVHGAGLLKAIRQTYNIFLLSKSSANQQVAQGTLAQMVGTVFERVKTRIAMKEARQTMSKSSPQREADAEENGTPPRSSIALDTRENELDTSTPESPTPAASESSTSKAGKEVITLQSFENRKSFDDNRINDDAPTMVTRIKPHRPVNRTGSNDGASSTQGNGEAAGATEEDEEDEIYTKDAFLVFRAMCKLSIKSLPHDQLMDLKSHGMRSKLLSLHLLHTILNNHIIVFTSPLVTIRSSSSSEATTFVHAVKQYLCLSLSRNGASSVNRVFEVSCEIFWLMLKHMRDSLKKEIEVFLKEIYLAILAKRTASLSQKLYLMGVLERFCGDPRALVETYLNYDCDRNALDNMFQRIIDSLSKIASTSVAATPAQQLQYQEQHGKLTPGNVEWQSRGMLPPSLSTANLNSLPESDANLPLEYSLKRESLDGLVETLRSLVNWSQQGIADVEGRLQEPDSRVSLTASRDSLEKPDTGISTPKISNAETLGRSTTPLLEAEDDPNQLERAKQWKTALNNGIKQFNFKPKRGIQLLVEGGFIPSDAPRDIAEFLLLQNEGLDKATIGEYLGEGEARNIEIMHAFVDLMDFTKTRFVVALRRFLQSFRLPGEAQKIDRFMLKFAERYISGNPNAFANADTAYVLAYSVILLNTDQHSSKMKGRRMTKEEFIKNNKGINDDADLPDEYLSGIYDEIVHNEIVLNAERDAAAALGMASQPTGGIASNIGQALATVGRDLQREAQQQSSEEMAKKTEQLFRNLARSQRKNASKPSTSRFIPASSFKHVGPMFEVTWMSFYSGLTGQMQDTENLETIKLCMEGFKLAIRIACLFDLETPRVAFVSALAKFTNLNNLSEMKAKNLEALKILLDVAQTEGNLLRGSWSDILTCISQLDRFQLISTGVDEEVIPDVAKARIRPQAGVDGRRQSHAPRRPRPRTTASSTSYLPDIAQETRSVDTIKSVDRIFTNTANLSGDAIVHFVRALSEVSWQEIQSSGQSESPRTFSLQKLVEISYYNMTRVRFEWTAVWQILGEHFNQVGCHTNTHVVFFALDSLRQLSMRFMEIEELPGFKFQKDFLKPFEHVMANSGVVTVKDMVLSCLIQMIQARGDNIRSGWRTMFGVFTVAAAEPYEGLVNLAFDHVTQIYNNRFGTVISQGAFADLVVCLTEFSKNMKFQKKSLQAIETIKATIPKMLKTPECPLSAKMRSTPAETISSPTTQSSQSMQEEQYWFPVLFAFHTVLMTGDDLEVRSRALEYLFGTLIKYGGDFSTDFWDILWRQLLYPIFMVLKSKSEMTKVLNHEELSVWLSTTMIQALRHMISLFSHYFESLEYMIDRFLDLLTLCICQENDTIARIGSNCLQQLILQNVSKFERVHWSKIVGAFVELFERTTAYQLFSAATSSGNPPHGPNGLSSPIRQDSEATLNDLPLVTPNGDTPTSPTFENALKVNGLSSSQSHPAASEEVGSTAALSATTPTQASVADGAASSELEDYRPQSSLQQQPVVVTAARRRFFNKIITRCVLQLLMIETVNELFSNDAVYARIPSPELLRLMVVLKKSFLFARKFNADKDLRMRLWREGFMKQPPNLLKQESGSAATYVAILFRMYHDEGEERRRSRGDTEAALIPLCVDIISGYTILDEETQHRNIVAWRPVVVDVMEGYTHFPREGFEKHIETFFALAVDLLNRDLSSDVRLALQAMLRRIGEVRLGLTPAETVLSAPPTPKSPSVAGSRRTSRAW